MRAGCAAVGRGARSHGGCDRTPVVQHRACGPDHRARGRPRRPGRHARGAAHAGGRVRAHVAGSTAARYNRRMRRLLKIICVVALLLVLVAGGLLAWLRSSRPDYDATVKTTGLLQRVEVLRDSLGVPQVFASNDADMFYAQGYLHAQDRLFQMELFRRVAEGRLAEILGSRALDTDRFMRTLGLFRAAATAERMLTPEARRMVEAYAAGVNAYIRERSGALPPEFIVLNFRPEAWTVRNRPAIEKLR